MTVHLIKLIQSQESGGKKKLSVIKDQVDGINVLLRSLFFIILRSNILSDNTGGI